MQISSNALLDLHFVKCLAYCHIVWRIYISMRFVVLNVLLYKHGFAISDIADNKTMFATCLVTFMG